MEKEKNVLRNKSIGTKVSDDEYAGLEKLAEARGLTLGEWLRELVLAELIAHPAEQTILAEILALRMLYLNTIQILGAGRELTTDELRKLIEKVGRGEAAQGRGAVSREGRPAARGREMSQSGGNLREVLNRAKVRSNRRSSTLGGTGRKSSSEQQMGTRAKVTSGQAASRCGRSRRWCWPSRRPFGTATYQYKRAVDILPAALSWEVHQHRSAALAEECALPIWCTWWTAKREMAAPRDGQRPDRPDDAGGVKSEKSEDRMAAHRAVMNAELHTGWETEIYQGHKAFGSCLAAGVEGRRRRAGGGLGCSLLPRDQKRRRVLKYGRRTKGPELVSAAEFNRNNQSDGIGFLTKERRTFTEFVFRREG